MALETWILFCITEALLCATPGPGVLLIVSLAMTNGTNSGLAATLGVLAANVLYFILAATGLAVALKASWEVFFFIKYLGAAYLIWLGIGLVRTSFGVSFVEGAARRYLQRRSFWQGFLTHGSNPKLLLFFTAILPQFVSPSDSFELQLMLLGVSALVIQTLILGAYSVLAGRVRKLTGSRLRKRVQRTGGVFLIGAGAGLATVGQE